MKNKRYKIIQIDDGRYIGKRYLPLFRFWTQITHPFDTIEMCENEITKIRDKSVKDDLVKYVD